MAKAPNLARRSLARDLLLRPLAPHHGWTASADELRVPERADDPPPWAIHVVYSAKHPDKSEELRIPLAMSFVEIEHYHSDDQMRAVVAQYRETAERTMHDLIDEWDAKHVH